jgi:hypothetical protein
MYRLLWIGFVFMAAASLSTAQDKKDQNTGTLIEAPDGRTGQGVVILNPDSTSPRVWVMFALVFFLLAIILIQIIFMRSDMERLLGGKGHQ